MNGAIGEAAGDLWLALTANGSMTKDRLRSKTKLDSETVTLALGWLAREDKIAMQKTGKKRLEVTLK